MYPLDSIPGVLFFKLDFWVGVNQKISQKVGVYSRKTSKRGLFTLGTWGCIQELSCNPTELKFATFRPNFCS